MKKSLFGSLIMVALVATSCSTYQYTARQTDINRQNITMAPTIVDIRADYNKRIEVTSSWCNTKEEAMNECKYLAITEKKADVVVDPIYKIEFKKGKLSHNYKASLTGFAGYYTNSRSVYEDMEQLQKFSLEDVEKYLIMHNPEVLKYMNAQGDVVNIFHGGQPPVKPGCCKEPLPEPAPVPAVAPIQANKGTKAPAANSSSKKK